MASTVTKGHSTLMAVLLEGAGVGVLVLMAGTGPDAGNVAVLLLTGFWLLFMVSNPGLVQKLFGQFDTKLKAG